jgi:hypothetical protein
LDKKLPPQPESARAVHSKKPLAPSNTVCAPLPSADMLGRPMAPGVGVRSGLPLCPMIDQGRVEFGADMWDTSDETEDEEIDDLICRSKGDDDMEF